MSATAYRTVDLPIHGMDCPSCASEVEALLTRTLGVQRVSVLLAAARATVEYAPDLVDVSRITEVVTRAGYRVPAPASATRTSADEAPLPGWGMLAGMAAAVMLIATGEHLGLFDRLLSPVPTPVKAATLLAAGWKPFLGVGRGLLRGRLTSHSLLVLGIGAASATGEWVTAGIVLFFMHVAEKLEALCAGRSREALRHLVETRPATARVLIGEREETRPVEAVGVGDRIRVRPGERIPVDGLVVSGVAPVDQSTVTGEAMPADKAPGDPVFAATLVQAGSLEIEATHVGADTTFAGIVRMVEEAETRKASVQRFADRFTVWYLPAVLLLAAVTYGVSHQIQSAVAVLVTACACSIALATPVVVIASVGSAARRGLLIKGGQALEQLARVDAVVLDKTGTVTTGKLEVAAIETRDDLAEDELLVAVATLERLSEHPLGEAVVAYARGRHLHLGHAEEFRSLPGRGIAGRIGGEEWHVGNLRMMEEAGLTPDATTTVRLRALQGQGLTVLLAARGREVAGWIALSDTLRPEAAEAVQELRSLGICRIVLLTGDATAAAARAAEALGVEFRAELLPEDKVAFVRELQSGGARVLMVGDGINDAPALAAAEVGMAMGLRGTDVALEAADLTLLRDDWRLVPEALRIGRRAVRTIRQNLLFSALYNLFGLPLAMAGMLPPVYAAAAHNLPDLLIMLNSSRLLSADRTARGVEPGMVASVAEPSPVTALALRRGGMELPMLGAPLVATHSHTHAHASNGCGHSHGHACCGGHH